MKTKSKILLSFEAVFSYRDLWMAVAILMVVFSHIPVTFPAPLRVLNSIREYSYLGVDMFLFASGIGCYHSLKKDPDVVRFLGRRAWSILPMWWIFLCFWFPLGPKDGPLTLVEVLGNLLGVGYLAGLSNQYNWYVAALAVFYLLMPVFAAAADRYRKFWQRGLILLLLFGLSLSYLGQHQLILWSRLMIFFVGVCTASSAKERGGLSCRGLVISLIAMILGIGFLVLEDILWRDIRWSAGILWYPCLFIAPGACYLLSLLGSFLDSTRLSRLLRLFRKLGKYTFPLFLTHMVVLNIFQELLHRGIVARNALGYGGGLAAIILATLVLVLLEKLVKKGLKAIFP